MKREKLGEHSKKGPADTEIEFEFGNEIIDKFLHFKKHLLPIFTSLLSISIDCRLFQDENAAIPI